MKMDEQLKAAREATAAFHDKSRKLERMNTALYQKILNHVLSGLQVNLLGLQVKPLVNFFDKESHGDIDLIVKIPEKLEDDIPLLNGICSQVIRRRPLSPFQEGMQGIGEYKGFEFQVDITWAKNHQLMVFANNLYSYGGAGAIAGAIARQMGYHLSHDGLYYKLPGELTTRFGNKVLMTVDWGRAIEFLGLDHWPVRFTDKIQMYKYFFESPFFDPVRLLATPADSKTAECLIFFREWLDYRFPKEDTVERRLPFRGSAEEDQRLAKMFPKIAELNASLNQSVRLMAQLSQ